MDSQNSQPEQTTDAAAPDRLQALEDKIEALMGVLSAVAPVASVIPGGAVAVGAVEAVGHTVEAVIDAIQGDAGDDPAAAAVQGIRTSTGNPELDARLVEIEAFITAATPLISFLSKHFGWDDPATSKAGV